MPIYGYPAWIAAVGIKEWPGLMNDTAMCTSVGLNAEVADNIWGPYFEKSQTFWRRWLQAEELRAGGRHVTAEEAIKKIKPGTFKSFAEIRERFDSEL